MIMNDKLNSYEFTPSARLKDPNALELRFYQNAGCKGKILCHKLKYNYITSRHLNVLEIMGKCTTDGPVFGQYRFFNVAILWYQNTGRFPLPCDVQSSSLRDWREDLHSPPHVVDRSTPRSMNFGSGSVTATEPTGIALAPDARSYHGN
ncbi:hypothetical protein BJ138DRAFT_1105259 [Hygrophoropsis aurantiaca]|uniref:Uncharacterized protein n=1 Tax=Hygrophoropsis aurantiaca TaxID=72124 RepID=A0ACB7ZZU8_9AGAM|nr:hypothetical protein BJ138DRAFT_1105259 [Hygrophoropsis aurantiaca]